jgi:serine/threonine-protein kinase
LARTRFRVVEKIDMGGMAEIYRGYATSLEGIQKEVAIKRVLPQLTKNRKFVAMFLDEARLSMHLNHGNIVQVFDVGRADDIYFIVMEYVDGHNLRRVFQRASERNVRIPVEIAVFVAMEILKGLAHAHEKRGMNGEPLQIVHRDVSPPNILLSKAGEVKLTDFGLAKAVTQLELTDPGVVKGKFSYLSPEAAEGRMVDQRADIFAVGTVLFELLANRRLFLGKTDLETVELVRKAEVPSVHTLNAEIPKDLDRILGKALARDPRKRYPSASDFAKALAEFLSVSGLHVTSLDLASFVGELFSEDVAESVETRIDAIIQEEIINLSSLGGVGEAFGTEASRPVKPDELTIESQRSGKLQLDGILPAVLPELTGAPPVRRTEGGRDMSQPSISRRSVVQELQASRDVPLKVWVAIVVGCLLLAFSLAYVLMSN